MTRSLISATPSPYARKIRIALAEKSLPFTLHTEVPWDSTNTVKNHNPLEKLPVLIDDDDDDDADNGHASGETVFESHYIMEYLEETYPATSLLSKDRKERLFAKKVEVVADGVCDALVLRFFERMRAPEAQSEEWVARQMRKVDAGFAFMESVVEDGKDGKGERAKEFVIGDVLGLADIAIGCAVGYVMVRYREYGLPEKFPVLHSYWKKLEERQSFRDTVPSPQTIKDKIV